MDIKSKILTYLKMGVLMLLALFISNILKNEVFINETPTIRPNVGPYLLARVQGIGQGGGSVFAFLFPGQKSQEELANQIDQQVASRLESIPLKAVSKGVYAKEDDKLKYIEVRTSEMTYRQYSVTIKGKEYKLRVPSDRQNLSPEQVQKAVEDGR